MRNKELIDKTCVKIYVYLALNQEKMGFNDLHRSINKDGFKMSKPTLSKHLKHLTRKKVLKREKVGKQQVFYEVNWENFNRLFDARRLAKSMEKGIESYKTFQSLSIEQQLALVMFTLRLTNLQQIQSSVLTIFNPKKAFDYNIELLFISNYFDVYKNWLIHECRKNKEIGKQVLQIIESEIEDYQNIIHDQKLTSSKTKTTN